MPHTYKFGHLISADTDNFVQYLKYDERFAVIKGLSLLGPEDTPDVYAKEIEMQERLYNLGFAPKLLRRQVKLERKGKPYIGWISEDAGLPIEDSDIPAANKILDELYDYGILFNYYPEKRMFLKGFDGKIRVTDFKHVESYEEPIGKHNRKYI